jgi:hypothetical protein
VNVPRYHLKLIVDKRSKFFKHQFRYDGTVASIWPILHREFSGADRELYLVVLLDYQWRVIGVSVIGVGSLTEVCGRARDIFKLALHANAAFIITAHNHPGGAAFPSSADRESYSIIEEAGRALGVPLEDNIILGEGREYFSFREESNRKAVRKLKEERASAVKRSLRRIEQGNASAKDVLFVAAKNLLEVPGLPGAERISVIEKVIQDVKPIAQSAKRIRRMTRNRANEIMYLAHEMLPVYEKGDFFSVNRIEQVLGFDLSPPKKPMTIPVVDFFEIPG